MPIQKKPLNNVAPPTWDNADAITLTAGATTNTSTTVTVASTTGLLVGMVLTATGITAGTTVASITNATTFVLSAAATATGAGLSIYATTPDPAGDVPDAITKLRWIDNQDKVNYFTSQRVQGDLFWRDLWLDAQLNALVDFVGLKTGLTFNGPLTRIKSSTMAATLNATTTVTVVSTALLAVGQTVLGTNIPALARIASITNATTFVLTAAATGSGSVTITIGNSVSLARFSQATLANLVVVALQCRSSSNSANIVLRILNTSTNAVVASQTSATGVLTFIGTTLIASSATIYDIRLANESGASADVEGFAVLQGRTY